MEHAARRAGLGGLPGLTGDLSGKQHRAAQPEISALFDDFETGRVSIDDYFARGESLLGAPANDLQHVMDAVVIEAYPGVEALLTELRQTGVKSATLSNTNARHWQLFTDPLHPSYLPLHLIDVPLGSQILGYAKPDEQAYRAVESRLDESGSSILFFDDLEENVEAAQRCGWQAELVPRMENPVPWLRRKLVAYGVLA
jgi:HAD superfamily hydrolase (TIGR01509 family)